MESMMRKVTFQIVVIVSLAAVAIARQAGPVAFEVASVKPNKSGQRAGNLRGEPGGRINATNMPLQQLVTFAFQVPPYLLAGAPPWIADERFDIVAKLEGNPPPPAPGSGPGPMNLAMQNLLADRFKLKFHRETREADMYALVMARQGGSPGPGLIPSKQDCSPQGVEARRASPPPGVFCGMQMGPGRIGLGGFPLSTFVNGLAAQVGRFVVDRTGLTGNWDFELKFIPEQPIGLPPGAELPPPDPNAASVFTALQEQLGLRLQATRGPVEFFVINSIERPIAD